MTHVAARPLASVGPWLVAVLAILVPADTFGAGAHHARLDDTGMNLCANPDNGQLGSDCAGTGQDGEFGRDVERPDSTDGRLGFSFVKICNSGQRAGEGTCRMAAIQGPGPDDWGCTQDRVTGLAWELRTRDGGLLDAGHTYSNENDGSPNDSRTLVAAVNALGLCGATDWRLPTRTELLGIADFRNLDGVLADTHWFPDVIGVNDGLWTSDGEGSNPRYAWWVNFDDGTVAPWAREEATWGIRLVRSTRPAMPQPRFTARGDEVVDCWTSLVWKRCVVGQWWNGSACAGTPAALIWKDALAQARTIADSTGLPWRLPNAKEIESIVVPANTPPIDFEAFPGATPTWVWSSTPSFLGNRRVWSPMVVEFSLGSLGNDNDGLSTFQSRLVRDVK